MIKLKNKLFFDPIFMSAVGILVSCRGDIVNKEGKKIGCGLSGKEKYDIRKFHKLLNDQMEEFNKVTKEMREDHGGVFDKKTNTWSYVDKDKEKTKQDEEIEDKLEKALEEFGKIEVEINRSPIAYNDIITDSMNAMEIGALEENEIMDFSVFDSSEPESKPEPEPEPPE